jgi:hypothetical protein
MLKFSLKNNGLNALKNVLEKEEIAGTMKTTRRQKGGRLLTLSK